MSNLRPTKKQKELLEFISEFIADNGYSPSYREIMAGCGYNSVATVAVHVNNLITRGHLIKRENSARSLEVVSEIEKNVNLDKSWFLNEVKKRFETADNIDDLYVLLGTLKILGLNKEFELYKKKLMELK